MKDKLTNFFRDKTVLILGFGLEGKSTYHLLRELGVAKKIAVADRNDVNQELACEVFCGENYLEYINDFDIIMKSPGIALFDKLSDGNAKKITSQTDLFLRFCTNRIIGVTGTKGKSTTSSLINHILNYCGYKSILVGNIGIPPLDNLYLYEDSIVVCEMSCHQLEYISASPSISVLLNIYEEHLDHYVDFAAYKKTKENIYRFLGNNNHLIYNIELLNKSIRTLPCRTISAAIDNDAADISVNESFIRFFQDKIPISSIKTSLPGRHNLYNIAVSLAACITAGCDISTAVTAVETFKGLPHRLESIGIINDVEYINDSISTIPEAAISALKSLPDADVLIVGGMDRGISYDSLTDFLRNSHLKNLIVLPGAGERIAGEITASYTPRFSIYYCKNMAAAVECAKTVAGKCCILSPAAASYDVYKNFEERGDDFRNLVLNIV